MNATLDQQLVENDDMVQQLRFHPSRAQNQIKTFADRHRREHEYCVDCDCYCTVCIIVLFGIFSRLVVFLELELL